jgi:hypothetical protein
MRYTVDRHYYSYFGGASKHEYKDFTNLLEAWHEYKRERANDFDYGDAWQSTTFRVVHDNAVALKPQRAHARSAAEWRRMVWDKEDALQRERLAVNGMDVLFMGSDGLFDDYEDNDLPF